MGAGSGMKAHARTQVSAGEHLALIRTTRWWAEVAAGLSTPPDQFGVSHTSQRGYLPFAEVQREDKMKELSHLIKGKRKKMLWVPSLQSGVEGSHAALASYTHTILHSFICNNASPSFTANTDVHKALREGLHGSKDIHET